MDRMHMPRQELLLEVINKKKGERRLLDDWVVVINNEIPSPRRLVKNSMTKIIGAMHREGVIILKKEIIHGNKVYEFG